MKKSKIQIRRASLKERLHFLFTGEIPGYWQKANNDVRMTLVQALADPEFPFVKEHKDNEEMLKNVTDFLATTRFSYKTIEKYIFRQPLLPHEEKSLLSGLFIETQNPDYFPKPSETTKKCPRIGMSGTSMKIYSTPNAMEKHLVIQNQQAIEKSNERDRFETDLTHLADLDCNGNWARFLRGNDGDLHIIMATADEMTPDKYKGIMHSVRVGVGNSGGQEVPSYVKKALCELVSAFEKWENERL